MRHGPHTTADDPSKYMTDDERERAKADEPIARFAAVLRERGLWNDDFDTEAWQRAEDRFDLAWERAQEATASLDPAVLFDHVYQQPTDRMERQRADLLRHLADVASGQGGRAMTVRTMLEAINLALHEEMARDERVLVFGQDVGTNGGVFRATEGLVDAFGDTRVVDMPLAEGVIVGSSVGLAASGLVPVAEIQFLGFSYQAMHQLVGQVARLRSRSGSRFKAPITIRAPFGGGVRTPELHSESLEGQFANCPGLKIAMPATAADAKGLLAASIREPDPVLFLEPLRGYRMVQDDVPDGEHVVELGRSRVSRTGTDLVIVAWSYMVTLADRAADELAEEGALGRRARSADDRAARRRRVDRRDLGHGSGGRGGGGAGDRRVRVGGGGDRNRPLLLRPGGPDRSGCPGSTCPTPSGFWRTTTCPTPSGSRLRSDGPWRWRRDHRVHPARRR